MEKDYGELQRMYYTHCEMYCNWFSQCLNCAHESKEKQNKHLKLCMNYESIKTIFPEPDKKPALAIA